MPVTPFHVGPGAMLHALAPRQVSFIGFCGANVLMDVEPLYFMLMREAPLHRFFHTWIGATLIALAVPGIFLLALQLARRLRLPNPLDWQGLGWPQVALGAGAGGWSHILFDSIMHGDMHPFAPFSQANPLLGLVALEALHWFCLLAGAAGLLILGLRRWTRRHG